MPRAGRRDQILEAAKALFSAKGYHATTIRDIANETGMLSGSLYAHVSSKEDLLFEIVRQAAEQFLAAIEPIVAGPGTATEKVRAALAAHIRVVAESTDAATVFLHEWRNLDPERRALIQAQRDRYEQCWAQLIAAGVASGEFRPVDQRFARLLILSVGNWLYQWYRPDGGLSPDELADRFMDLILYGLHAGTAAPPPGAAAPGTERA